MLRELSEPPYFAWLGGLLSDDAEVNEEPEPQFIVRFFTEMPHWWRTDSRQRVKVISERVRRQAGKLLANGTPAAERRALVLSLMQTLNGMAGEMDRFSVVCWWEPVASVIRDNAPADHPIHSLMSSTLGSTLHHPNPFIQLSALLALNLLPQAERNEKPSLRPIRQPSESANPDFAEWVNRLLAGEAAYPDPAIFR